MSAISDFVDKQNAHNAASAAGIDKIVADLGDIKTGVTNLQAQIAALQNSSGTITPADQALLDGVDAAAQALQDKVTAAAANADAVDALNPPVAPPAAATP